MTRQGAVRFATTGAFAETCVDGPPAWAMTFVRGRRTSVPIPVMAAEPCAGIPRE